MVYTGWHPLGKAGIIQAIYLYSSNSGPQATLSIVMSRQSSTTVLISQRSLPPSSVHSIHLHCAVGPWALGCHEIQSIKIIRTL